MMVKPYKAIVMLGLSWLLMTGQAAFSAASVAHAEGLTSDQLAHERQVLFEEMPLVQLLSEQDGYAKTVCAGSGLNHVKPSPDGSIILIPNAGDLAVDGSNVSIKLSPDGQITFVPRTQGQKIRVPVNVGGKVEGEEVLSLTLDETMQLMAGGHLVWTAKDQGPYGNGYGLPGHIAACDPSFDESVYEDYIDSQNQK